jgi:hypothetical protein
MLTVTTKVTCRALEVSTEMLMCLSSLIRRVQFRFERRTTSVMPRGASPKREREYKEIEHKFEKEGRYKGREKEVAARIVNKQRAQAGETKNGSKTSSKRVRKKK